MRSWVGDETPCNLSVVGLFIPARRVKWGAGEVPVVRVLSIALFPTELKPSRPGAVGSAGSPVAR